MWPRFSGLTYPAGAVARRFSLSASILDIPMRHVLWWPYLARRLLLANVTMERRRGPLGGLGFAERLLRAEETLKRPGAARGAGERRLIGLLRLRVASQGQELVAQELEGRLL